MNTTDHADRASAFATHRDAVAAETARFVHVLRGADLAAPVPTCPGWTLADLVRHSGSVQRWFAALLRKRIQERPLSREVELRLPESEDGYADWLADSAAEAASAFAGVDPEAPMWAWGADQHEGFWARRMLFETLVHRADAELALGRTPVIDPALATDGVDEFLVNLPFATPFAPGVAELRGTGETLRFRCTDTDGDWTVRLRPDGFGLEPSPAGADATVQGSAADLLLLVYGRLHRDAPAFEVSGDEDLLKRWAAHSKF
ncbi:maleylpyruvate isomerase family mycothiol-dependent enzyme [Streptomyces roseoverticillatus]|uniref:maleylpyruvate isomerase family mycothiol-dependent enzyme n=1 Tax=Streptomyces roseoverticillatus TaxID=66429 RepID=UPI001F1F5AEB|nr:maleylpyruvate isomerase family mycothiol-dependent enzyme [Streptomyces roseoverticillatus]MCF3101743.1 maleylpyruvate isomerase family mycothiol-dependent enzyme [Streptomyces roseoverticillatus]